MEDLRRLREALVSNDISQLTIPTPDDWHVHFRDGEMLGTVVPYTATRFGRAIVMPNLVPPITSVKEAVAYRQRIRATVPAGSDFEPLMTCYMTEHLNPDELSAGFREGVFAAVKLYPRNATTNAGSGVNDMRRLHATLERMQRDGMPLLIHGEATDPEVDVYDREAVFIDRTLRRLVCDFPALKIVFEHVTACEAVDFVVDRHAAAPGTIGATITVHHLMINRTDMFRGGIRPHLYCLPIAKRERHRQALRQAATSGEGPFFLGTDSAPHTLEAKQSACGCAGIFSAPMALELYAQVFEEMGALGRLAAFACTNGPAFYGLPVHAGHITLERHTQTIPTTIGSRDSPVAVFCGGMTTPWRVARRSESGTG